MKAPPVSRTAPAESKARRRCAAAELVAAGSSTEAATHISSSTARILAWVLRDCLATILGHQDLGITAKTANLG